MLNNKYFWLLARNTVLLTWIALFFGAFGISTQVNWIFKISIVVLLLIHSAEIPISLKIGKDKQLPTRTIIIKTLMFGFTWWLPLRKEIISE